MSEEVEAAPKPKFKAAPAPKKQSRAYKDRYESLKDQQAATALRVQTALTLLKANGDNTCDGNTLKAAISLLEGK